MTNCPSSAVIAQDILAAPASQAYVERGFSVCGLLAGGRRNRNITYSFIRHGMSERTPPATLHDVNSDQVIANGSLFENEQKSLGEHRHQCLCVKFRTLTLMEMDCK